MFNHSDKDKTTRGSILNATLELIKTEGLDNVTSRKIASCAAVNLALINYYFGSKENLVNESLQMLLADFQEHFLILDDFTLPPKQRLKTFLNQYAASVCRFPELVRELLGKGELSFDSHKEYVKYMKTLGVSKIELTIREITGEEDPDKLRIMLMHIHSAVFFPIMISQKTRDFSPAPMCCSHELQIDILLDHYFAKYAD